MEASPAGPGRSVQEVERGARQGSPSQHSGFFKMYRMVMIGHDWSGLVTIGHDWSGLVTISHDWSRFVMIGHNSS